jgi:hypothetical protein
MIKNKKNSSSIVFFFVLLEIRKNLARAGFNSSFFIARAFCSSERGSSYLQGSGSSNQKAVAFNINIAQIFLIINFGLPIINFGRPTK